ncbi:MAG: hypothetical protein IJR87_04635 [Bacteroidaceae bacterium]|nr:hypothetical protein [Bacteroidaceae bacterium]
MENKFINRFYGFIVRGKQPPAEEWQKLQRDIEGRYLHFYEEMHQGELLREKEYRLCLLIKLGLRDKETECLLGYSPHSLSTIKRRVLKKIYGIEGSTKELKKRIGEVN